MRETPFADFQRVYYLTLGTAVKGGQRPGQWLFNSLFTTRPDVAEMIRNTVCDPFYEDARIYDALKKIEELW